MFLPEYKFNVVGYKLLYFKIIIIELFSYCLKKNTENSFPIFASSFELESVRNFGFDIVWHHLRGPRFVASCDKSGGINRDFSMNRPVFRTNRHNKKYGTFPRALQKFRN